MMIKQIAIDEAMELHKRGLMVGVLKPVVPEPKNLDDYEFLTLKKILAGCEFFRIVPEEEKGAAEPVKQAEKEEKPVEEVAAVKKQSEPPKPEPAKLELPKPEPANKKQIDAGRIKALYKAGWTGKKIAEDMRIAESTVCTYLKKIKAGEI